MESFIFKFNHLWKTGQDARIDIHSHAGNAWVGISLNLGQYPGHKDCQDSQRKKSVHLGLDVGKDVLLHAVLTIAKMRILVV